MKTVSFTAMGTNGHLQIVGPGARRLGDVGLALVGTMERRWSRFLPESDISRINDRPGQDVVVDRSTVELLRLALAAWRDTGGLFSPFLGRAMHDIGYSRPWPVGATPDRSRKASIVASRVSRHASSPRAPMQLDPDASTASVDHGVSVDLGGLAKGYSADLILRTLLDAGATSALVDIGGDMAFSAGADRRGADVTPWAIAVDDPFVPTRSIDTVVAAVGGIATSSTLRRRWNCTDGRAFHHLVDPLTGTSSCSDVAAVTVVADSGVNAEVLAKQLLLLGRCGAEREANRLGVDVLIVGHDRYITRIGTWEGTRP